MTSAVVKAASFFVERDELMGLLGDAVKPDYNAADDTGYNRICKIVSQYFTSYVLFTKLRTAMFKENWHV